MIVTTATEVSLGRAAEDDIEVDHPSVEPAHARVAVRRGRVLVIPSPKVRRRVQLDAHALRAPAIVPAGGVLGLGDVTVSVVEVSPDDVPLPSLDGWAVLGERPAYDEQRRFAVCDDRGDLGELSVARGAADVLAAWAERVQASAGLTSFAAMRALGLGGHGHVELIEGLGRGVRLSAVLTAIARGAVQVPIEASVVIGHALLTALSTIHPVWGALGSLDPRAIHLGVDGRVSLVRPAPRVEAWQDPVRRRYLAPERRYGGPPTRAADVWAAGKILRELGARPGALRALGAEEPSARPLDLQALAARVHADALAAGLDPSTTHVARLARLVVPPDRPLARVRDAGFDPGFSVRDAPARAR